MKLTTKNIAILGMLTAMYVVLSAFLKFSIVGNIMVDLGYIAFAFALCMFGPWGAIVGVLGCALESILFSAYGFSVSWVAANLFIGLVCGFGFWKSRNPFARILITIISVAVAMLGIKTLIECNLYNIPWEVKMPKNAVAFAADAVTMVLGISFYEIFRERIGETM